MNAADAERVREIVEGDSATFVGVTPFRELPSPMGSAEEVISSICARDIGSFEIHSDGESILYGVRGRDFRDVRGQLESRYPQAVLGVLPEDPLVVREGEVAATTVLRVGGADVIPLQIFDDAGIESGDTDPLISVVGAMGSLPAGVRVLVRMLARAKPGYWTEEHRRMAISGSGGANEETRGQEVQQQRLQQGNSIGPTTKVNLISLFLILSLAVGAMFGLPRVGLIRTFEDVRELLIVGGAAAVVSFAALIMLWLLVKLLFDSFFPTRNAYKDPNLAKLRVDAPTYDVEIQAIVFSPSDVERGSTVEARRVMDTIVSRYKRYDRARESYLFPYAAFAGVPPALEFTRRRRWHRIGRDKVPSIAVLREVAGLWHLPGTNNNPAGVRKARSTRLPLHSNRSARGAPIGVTTAGRRRLVRIPPQLFTRHTFFAAASGQGKSTAMAHVIRHAMQRKAAGDYAGAIVVVDPHSLLVRSLLPQVPREIAHKVRLLDLGNRDYLPGINLLSPSTSPDRDIAAECLAKVLASEHPDFWGPRMDALLRNSARTLYEANRNPRLRPQDKYTLLDIGGMLEDEAIRREVLEKVRSGPLRDWWQNTFPGQVRGNTQSREALLNRLAEYAISPVASVVFGQPLSTVDLRASVDDGDIIFVDTNSSAVGEKVSFLMGSFVLMAIDKIVREREEDSVQEMDHTIVVVDEMQVFKGVPFDAMLNEWRKFGASLNCATLNLEALRSASRTIEQSVLTNVGILGVFQVSSDDAEDLAPELGRDLVTANDLESLQAHNFYLRLRGPGIDIPPFSVELLPPDSGDLVVADAIGRRSARYKQNAETVRARMGF